MYKNKPTTTKDCLKKLFKYNDNQALGNLLSIKKKIKNKNIAQ